VNDRRFFVVVGFAAVLIIALLLVRDWRDRAVFDDLPKTTSLSGAFTAREGVAEARRIAALWDPAAFLQCVRIAYRGDPHSDDPAITFEGAPIPPSGWMYRFFSRPRGRFLVLTLTPDGLCDAESESAVNYLNSQPLADSFLDSSRAFEIAEESFGRAFRKEGLVVRMYAQATTWPSNVGGPPDPTPHRSTWQIHYIAPRRLERRVDLYLMLDAVDGSVLTVQEDEAGQVRTIHNGFAEREVRGNPPRRTGIASVVD